jgi:two-component system, chemotaxis family, CheB/CheR fusion protein
MPYRTFDDRIDGLVITFIDISELKLVEEKWQKVMQENRLLADLSSNVFIKLSSDWKILEFNPAAERFFGKKREDITGKNFYKLFIPEMLQTKTEQEMTKLLKSTGINNIKMKVIEAGEKESDIECQVKVHFNHLQIPFEVIIILITNKL